MTIPLFVRRPEHPADAGFRFDLFCRSLTPWQSLEGVDAGLRGMLLRQQFDGQSMTYRSMFPDAQFDIVEQDGAPIGRIVVDRAADFVTLVDLALLPDWRGRGIGTRLIHDVCSAADRPVRLSVRRDNARAGALYVRLGFRILDTDEIEARMEWAGNPSSRRETGAASHQGRSQVGDGTALPDRLRLPLAFDPAPLASEVAALASHAWIAHFVTQNYDGDWSAIPLRGKAGATHPITMIHADPACRDFADTPFLDACPAIRAVLAAFACPLDSVRLMRLRPGAVIKEHVDHDLDVAQGAVRFHVPITTNADVAFRLNGTPVTMSAGSTWYLRLADPHSVANNGTGDRVHLVIDARVTPWVERLLAAAHDSLLADA